MDLGKKMISVEQALSLVTKATTTSCPRLRPPKAPLFSARCIR